MIDGLAINAAREVLEGVAEQQGRNATGVFDILHPTVHIAARLGKRLAVLAGNGRTQRVVVVFDELAITEKHAGALDRRRLAPRRKGGVRGGDRGVDLGRATDWALRDDVACRGIEDGRGGQLRGAQPFAGDVVGDEGEHE